jgi:A/G-specific adenine glycosylase
MSSLDNGELDVNEARYVTHFPPLTHVFTHLKLTMHAYQYRIAAEHTEQAALTCKGPPARKWVDADAMDDETLSTGMRKCWELISKNT